MLIERRFQRSLQQELSARKRLRISDAIIIAVLAMIGADNTSFPADNYLFRILAWAVIATVAYGIVVLGFAQIRAKSQPMDHTLRITAQDIEVVDNFSRKSQRHPWTDFERVAISDAAFEFKLKAARRGEVYHIRRSNLSAAEDAFLGEQLVELT